MLRDAGDESRLRVLVIATLGARERRRLGRKSKAAEGEPAPVTTTRATIIQGQPVDEDGAKAWLKVPDGHVPPELATLNRVLHLHRVATADATVREVRRSQAIVIRVGYGTGDEVADGRWTEAIEPRAEKIARRGREAALRPQERLAALLGGKDAALACEELILRARTDLDAGRLREAALQLRVAFEAALSELEAWRERGDLEHRLEELRADRGVVGEAANAALRGGLDAEAASAVERIVGRVEAALRSRSASGWS